MKLIGAFSTAVLSLTIGIGIPAFAQQEQRDQQEERKDQPAQEKERKAQQEKSGKHDEKNARQEDRNKPEEKNAQEARPGKQDEHARGRIPDDRFRANFGRDHRFRVSEADYRRDRRFQYGGYWFGFAQPWPANWLYTQNVYVIEIDGVYYLCNESYPGVNITLNVTL
jgi:hypothetical protein